MKKFLIGIGCTASFLIVTGFFVLDLKINGQVPSGGGGMSGGGSSLSLTAPIQANWTAFNVTGLTQAVTFANARFEWATNISAENIQGIAIALPTVPYTKIFRVWPMIANKAFGSVGVGWADGTVGTPGKLKICDIISSYPSGVAGTLAPSTVAVQNFTSTTVFSAQATLATGISIGTHFSSGIPVWFRVADNNTNFSCDISYDYNGSTGNWLNIFTETRNTFLTATQLIVAADSANSGNFVKVVFDSFQ